MEKYTPHNIEAKWQELWTKQSKASPQIPKNRSKRLYCLDMFPYPSEAGLHVGNIHGFTATDIYSRCKRMQGFNVLHPMGWDAFGLPTEQHAIITGEHPADITSRNCRTFHSQMNSLGLNYDWDREITTSDPKYYKWTQWIFIQFYNSWFDDKKARARPISELPIPKNIKKSGPLKIEQYKAQFRLAYYADSVVNWCPELGTVLSNEEVVNGRSVRGGHAVVRRPMKQWHLRITKYAERLLTELEDIDWPENIKEQQRNWIGKRFGTEIDFKIQDSDSQLTVFTTRADTLFGVTFLVLSPEHPLLNSITNEEQRDVVKRYCENTSYMSELARAIEVRKKTGVFTGAYAINPISKEAVPVFVGNYVLMSGGTGAVMGVPAHDEKDFDFARTFELEIRPVIAPYRGIGTEAKELRNAVIEGEVAFSGEGEMLSLENPTFISLGLEGKGNIRAKHVIVEWLVRNGGGRQSVSFRLRDWVFSRQRYWGEPIPMIHWDDGTITPADEQDLPLLLPERKTYTSFEGITSPLESNKEWREVVDFKNHRKGVRECQTMPQWAGSCWYYLRFLSPDCESAAWQDEKEWMPVDLYVGTGDHAVLHLLYVRFWHKVLYDLGHLSTKEPFGKLFTLGITLANTYKNRRGEIIPIDEIEFGPGDSVRQRESGEILERTTAKMSRGALNIVTIEEVLERYGSDALRLAEVFSGPLDTTRTWDTKVIVGSERFLKRVWTLAQLAKNSNVKITSSQQHRNLHQLIKKVSDDISNLHLNTAVSAMMEFINLGEALSIADMRVYLQLLAPFAPHIAEELWQQLGGTKSIFNSTWPKCDDKIVLPTSVNVVIQIDGKRKTVVEVKSEISEKHLRVAVVQALKYAKCRVKDDDRFITVYHTGTAVPRLVNIVTNRNPTRN